VKDGKNKGGDELRKVFALVRVFALTLIFSLLTFSFPQLIVLAGLDSEVVEVTTSGTFCCQQHEKGLQVVLLWRPL